LSAIFLRGKDNRRPVFGGERKFRKIRTGEITCNSTSIFTVTNGAGLGASHQTGWTGVIARAMHFFCDDNRGTSAGAWKALAFVRTDVPAQREGRGGDGWPYALKSI